MNQERIKQETAEIINVSTIIHEDALRELIRAALHGNLKKEQFFLATNIVRQMGNQLEGIPLHRLLKWANHMSRQEKKNANKQVDA